MRHWQGRLKMRESPLPKSRSRRETSRCLSCGASIVDENKCIGCGVCTTKCGFDAIKLHREHPECSKMVPSEEKMKHIIPYAIKQAVRVKVAGKKG